MKKPKTIEVEDIQALRLDEAIKDELYSLKETAEEAGALKHLLFSDGWDELKKVLLEDAQTAILQVILVWKEGDERKLDVAIARMEQTITFFNTISGSGANAKEAEELLAQRVEDIVEQMG